MIKGIEDSLKETFPDKLLNDFIKSYLAVKENFRKDDYSGVISKSGKFSENTFRLLYYLDKREVIPEIRDMAQIENSISKNMNYSEAIRIIMPRVARSIIYTLRSKKDSVHVKELIPGFMDASLNMTAVNWILAELLREFSSKEEETTVKIIRELMKRNYPLVQVIEGQRFITRKLGAEPELLLILFDVRDDGMNRTELGMSLKTYAAPTITNLLKKLESERKIFKAKSGKYYITDLGEDVLAEVLIAS